MRTLLLTALIFLLLIDTFSQGQPEGLFLGAKAPDFKANDQFDREIQFRIAAKNQKAVILFYRGYWCPHCTRLLSRIQDSLHLFTEKGVTVMAVSPESSVNRSKTLEKTKAGFSLISDSGLTIIKKYDLAYELSESQLSRYRTAGLDIPSINYPNGPYLSVPAVFIVGKDYTINFRFFDPEHKTRISVKQILDNL
jgi:peroxiredoxin